MNYTSWFIPLSIIVSSLFTISVIILTIATLIFRTKIIRKYDRGRRTDV